MSFKPGNDANLASPTPTTERIVILDSLRGIAILGILLMNIPGFALPDPIMYNPGVLNETGLNYNTWYFVDWSLEGSQRALFSMLFGAGVILFLGRQQKKVDGMLAAEYFFRRQLWLLVFGLFNAFILLWFWDILFQYALCGMILFAFHRLSPKSLLFAACICLVLQTARENRDLYLDKKTIARGEAIAKLDTTTVKLTELQKERLGAMTAFKEKTSPEGKQKEYTRSLMMMTGSYADLYEYQSARSFRGEVKYTYFGIWDILLFMFIGMAFFKNGLLTGGGSFKIYFMMMVIGLGLGLTISYFRLQPMINNQFNYFNYVKDIRFEYYELSRSLRAIGIFGLTMVMYKAGWFNWLFKLLQPVGQMAFTNYLGQSFLCGLFFYGIGFGKFGQLERYEIYFVVAAVWILQIAFSHIWLKYFRFGPLEWLWRSLTYWKKQPMRKIKTTDTIVLKAPAGDFVITESKQTIE